MGDVAVNHLWAPIAVERTATDLWEMSTDGMAVYVDIAALWNGPDTPPDDQPFGDAVIRLDWRRRGDGLPWTMREYASWLQNGARVDWDGNARLG